ncbi:angio-associated migratory cell protein-like [Anopheles albimanus]|uniref:angio-associated migratory cell protein-like n=1 Tax=Anopheles albimanus TaxID=7167 RepID=UPI00163E6AD0|nr:angio-associated migratory cell protein-like [Anopheles albimanus]XP_035789091.1 angio-associated migratory cell protein-like [Anopheles albimanus]
MRDNTPPHSPYVLEGAAEDDEDELVYVGDADEVLDAWENEANEGDEDEDDMDGELNAGEEAAAGSRSKGRDDAKLTFRKHTSSVFCGKLHPTLDLAVTGGEDDKAYVWNTTTGEVVHEVINHTDSVISVGFSHDGAYVATADMAGNIQVLKASQNYRKVWEFNMGDTCWMRWHEAAHILLAGAESGEVYVWRIPSGDCKVLQGHGVSCETAQLTHDGKKLAVGYSDGHFKLWDLKTNTTTLEVTPGTAGLSANITSLAVDRDNQLFVAGGENGRACVIGSSGVVGVLAGQDDSSIEAVLVDYPEFELKVAATGSLQGKITIWDVARQTKRVECTDEDPTGITNMVWLKDNMICAGTLGGRIKAWDLRSGAMRFALEGHEDDVHSIVYHKEKNIILSTSEDGTAKIFEVPA